MTWIFDHPWELGLVLAALLAIVLELGFRASAYSHILSDPNRKEQMGTIRDGVFVLLSLLLGFTLSLAAVRAAERRSLLEEEVVSIGTAFHRTGTLPQPYRTHSESLFRDYVIARLDLANAGLSASRFADAEGRSKRIQEELWNDAATVAQSDRSNVTALYLEALNQVIDLDEKRIAAFEYRIPRSIWVLITCVAFIAVFARGLTLTSRFWLTLILIPATIAIVVALIADLDAPSSGWIRLDTRALQRLKIDMTGEMKATGLPFSQSETRQALQRH